MTRNKWIIVIVVAIVILGSLIGLSGQSSLDVSNIDTSKIISANTKAGNVTVSIGDHVYGNTSGKVMLVEYGDLQCPSCGALQPQLQPLTAYYKDSLTFVFRNFPLTTLHPNALAAATAAEAAGLQGKYWDMNNLLYNNQTSWSNSDASTRTGTFKGYAQSLGLNVTKFTDDLSSTAIATKINFDKALGDKIGVNATPTVYLQGKEIANDTGMATKGDATALEADIRSALKAAGLSYPDKTYPDSLKTTN